MANFIFEIIVSAAAIAGFGVLIDHFADTSPIFTAIGACVGAVVTILIHQFKK